MTQPVTVVYIVEMTEHERGWGQRPDGNLAFVTEADAKSYVDKVTADRKGPVPDEYTSYHMVGYRECSAEFFSRFEKNKTVRLYVHRLGDLRV